MCLRSERGMIMRRRHTIDVLFSLSLFMVFVICSFLLLLFQINGYHHISEEDDQMYMAASFLQTSLRQHDVDDSISIEEIEGITCLKIQEQDAVTYLYVQDGMMKELYQEIGVNTALKYGDERFEVSAWSIKKDGNLITFLLKSQQDTLSFSVSLKSGVVVS